MPSDAFQRFIASTKLDVYAWKDGTPYDLAALDEMTGGERMAVEAELCAKHQLDWRDVEALERIGTAGALARVKLAGGTQTDGGGAAAFAREADAGWTAELETRLIAKLERSRSMEQSLDVLLGVAEAHPTPHVRAELFRLALEGHEDVRYSCGAFLLYLAGHAGDWYGLDGENRPHLLDLLHGDTSERKAAAAWLRERIDHPKAPAST